MMSCGGTSKTRMRRSTRTICCTPGMMKMMPGPNTRCTRPRKNTTARSYSRRILIVSAARMTSSTSAPRMNWIIFPPPL
jgi:hypothetical protein